MLKCSRCPDTLIVTGFICDKCSRVFCSKHSQISCPFCNDPLTKFDLENEEHKDFVLQWATFKENKKMGIVNLDNLPRYISEISHRINSSENLKVILFGSKEDSLLFEHELSIKNNVMVNENRKSSEKSRYTYLSFEKENANFLLLNTKAIEKGTAIFLTNYFSRLNSKFDECKTVIERDHRFSEVVAKSFFYYNNKMAIPFVVRDGIKEKIVSLLSRRVELQYVDYLAIRDLQTEEFLSDLVDFLTYRIKLNLDMFDYDMRFVLSEIYGIIAAMFQIALTLEGLKQNRTLFDPLLVIFQREHEKFKVKYKELPDLLKIIELIFSNIEEIDFSSYDKYILSCCTLFDRLIKELKPVYVSLSEGITLLEIKEFYLQQSGEGFYNERYPNVGSFDDYLNLLKKVFSKTGIYPEIRIMAGLALTDVLGTYAIIEKSRFRFQEFLDTAKSLNELVIISISEIKKKNGGLPDVVGSPISYESGVSVILDASVLARAFGNINDEFELNMIADDISTKFNLLSIQFRILWWRFITTQNFNFLHKMQEIAQKANLDKFPENALIILSLTQAVISKHEVESKLKKAEKEVFNVSTPLKSTQFEISQLIGNSEALFYIFEIFKSVLLFKTKPELLNKVQIYCLALEKITPKTDPHIIFSLKTRLLQKLTLSQYAEANEILQVIKNNIYAKFQKKEFMRFVKKWINACKNKDRRTYLNKKDFLYLGEDIWLQALSYWIELQMEIGLDDNISSSTAIVFVEGQIDQEVFTSYSKKISPSNRISFFDIEGFSNYSYYTEGKIVKKLGVPLYLILDGDVNTITKGKIIEQIQKLSLPSNHVYTLRKKTIEDYLLNSNILKRAFPNLPYSSYQIDKFLFKNKTKKNKKALLESLFKKVNMKYDLRAARRIADSSYEVEIEEEIRELMKKLFLLKPLS
jgi:hypothetical protein